MSRLMFPPTLLLNLPTRTSRGKKQNQNISSNWSRLSLHLQWWRQSWLARISHLGHLWPSLLLNGPSLWPWLPVILINVGWKIILFNSYRKFGFNQWQQSGDTIKYKISQHMVNSFHFSCQETSQPMSLNRQISLATTTLSSLGHGRVHWGSSWDCWVPPSCLLWTLQGPRMSSWGPCGWSLYPQCHCSLCWMCSPNNYNLKA